MKAMGSVFFFDIIVLVIFGVIGVHIFKVPILRRVVIAWRRSIFFIWLFEYVERKVCETSRILKATTEFGPYTTASPGKHSVFMFILITE